MMPAMCDIHMHLIPRVDDGAMNMEMSLSMLYQSYLQGVREVFATPHSSAFDQTGKDPQTVFRALEAFSARIPEDMRLYPGCEVRCDAFAMKDILSALESGRYPTLNGTRYVLTEFSPWGTPELAVVCTDTLTADGWIPVIAHLERYSYLQGRQDILSHFRHTGCRIQINVCSLAEEPEDLIRNWTRELVRTGQVDFLGSDAHNTGSRPPRVEAGLAWIRETCSEAYARQLIRDNARQLLTGL